MRRYSSTMLITDVPEIDLFECLKYDGMRNFGQLRTYLPKPYGGFRYIQLSRSRVRYGYRPWFQAPCCQRNTSKLYIYGGDIKCRKCLELKYPSQNSSDPAKRLAMTNRKQERLLRQQRRMWHGGIPSRFGEQFIRLNQESEALTQEMLERNRLQSIELDIKLSKEEARLGIE